MLMFSDSLSRLKSGFCDPHQQTLFRICSDMFILSSWHFVCYNVDFWNFVDPYDGLLMAGEFSPSAHQNTHIGFVWLAVDWRHVGHAYHEQQ